MALKLGTSGVRGTFLELTPEIVAALSQAFSTYVCGGAVAVAADTRPSGKYIEKAVISGLIATGAGVNDFGVLPTPVLQWIIRNGDYAGGISISGGHTSFEWNSLIFLHSEGAYLNPLEVEEFFNLYHSNLFSRKGYDQLGSYSDTRERMTDYFRVISDNPKKGAGRLKFAVDCSNGAAAGILPELSEALDIEIIPLFCDMKQPSQKDPEPGVANAGVLSTVVKETACDGGFQLNSDGSRILVVDETGSILSEELTLPIFAKILLEEEKSNIVTTYSTSKAIDKVAREFGVRVYRTDVGPPSVLQMAMDVKASIGGEGSGSVVYTPFSYGYDSFLFIKKMIDYLRKRETTVSALAQEFDPPEIHKTTIHLPADKIYSMLEKAERSYPHKRRLRDGIYVEDGDEWLCIRASSTMAMIRIVGEGNSVAGEIEKIREEIK